MKKDEKNIKTFFVLSLWQLSTMLALSLQLPAKEVEAGFVEKKYDMSIITQQMNLRSCSSGWKTTSIL